MQTSEIVERINNGEKVGEVAKSLGIAQSTLSRKLKVEGYFYNNSTKVYEIINKNNKSLGEISDKNNKEIPEAVLTEEEIAFVKDLYNNKTRINDFEKEFLSLPLKEKETKKKQPGAKEPAKHTIIISQQTDKEWTEFVKKAEQKYKIRVGKHDLYEMALRKFMRDFS